MAGTFASTAVRRHAPHTHPCLTPVAIQERLVQLRLQRPHWGPRKLLHRLAKVEPGLPWPAPSTAGEMLTRPASWRHGVGDDGHRRHAAPADRVVAQRGVGHRLQRVVPDARWDPD